VNLINSIKVDGKQAFKSTVGHRFLEDLDDLPTGDEAAVSFLSVRRRRRQCTPRRRPEKLT
jgi:hypothetical protein